MAKKGPQGAANKISNTALHCASMRAVLHKLCPNDYIDNRGYTYQCLLLGRVRQALALISEWFFRINNGQPLDKIGLYGHIFARKIETDEIFKEISEQNSNNYENIVLLGAGLDTSFHEFSEKLPNEINLYEVDSPFCQNYKLEIIEQTKYHCEKSKMAWSERIKYCSLDFEKENFMLKLATDCQFDASKRTLYVWHGVAQYLDESSVRDCLASIRTGSQSVKSRIFMDSCMNFSSYQVAYLGEKAIDNAKQQTVEGFKRLVGAADKMGEPWKSGVDVIAGASQQEMVEKYFGKSRFNVVEVFDKKAINEKYFTCEDGTENMTACDFCNLVLIEVA